MSDEEDGAVEDKRVDWLLERVEHRPLMFKLDRINKMKIDEHSMCVLICRTRRASPAPPTALRPAHSPRLALGEASQRWRWPATLERWAFPNRALTCAVPPRVQERLDRLPR